MCLQAAAICLKHKEDSCRPTRLNDEILQLSDFQSNRFDQILTMKRVVSQVVSLKSVYHRFTADSRDRGAEGAAVSTMNANGSMRER